MQSVLDFLDVKDSGFCNRCRTLEFDALSVGYVLHDSLEHFQKAATNNCYLCSVLWHGLLIEANDAVFTTVHGQECSVMILYETGDEPQLTVALISDRACIQSATFGVYIPRDDFPSHNFRLPQMNPISDQAIGVVKKWFHECQTTHSHCTSNFDQLLPTRVLDVSHPSPRIHATNGTRGVYLTLSHCWGQVEGLTTTSDTFDERCTGIDMADLPVNFRDAVIVTRKLGFKYLWIDSLCIIQDSKSDWEVESAQMHDIYRNGSLTLCAARATDSQIGFLHLTPSEFKACGLVFPPEEDGIQERMLIYWPRQQKQAGIVETRAWIMQELVLSPRVVHLMSSRPTKRFHNPKLWECQSLVEWEDGDPKMAYPPARFDFQSIANVDEPQGPASILHLASVYRQWYKFVISYMNRLLTKLDDRLPALSGMTAVYRTRLDDEWLAGLWRGDLAVGLLWMPMSPVRKPVAYRAPSWSWASIEASILHWPLLTTILHQVDILDAKVTLQGLNPFGQLQSGYITVRGRTKKLDIDPIPTNQSNNTTLYPPGGDGRTTVTHGGPSHLTFDVAPDLKCTHVTLLMVVESLEHDPGASRMYGLILVPANTGDEIAYKRVGMFKVFAALKAWFDGAIVECITIV